MKLVAHFLTLVLTAVLVSPAVGVSPDILIGVGTLGAMALAFSPLGNGILFEGAITIAGLATELRNLFQTEPGLPKKWFYDTEIMLRKFAKRVSQVKGKWIVPHSLMTNVVQGFKNEWTPLGELVLKSRTLQPFHLKVNFPVDPTTIEGTYISWANEENRALQDRTVSRFVAEFLNEKIVDDLNFLSIAGEFDEATKNTVFGASMNGIVKVITDAVAATKIGPSEDSMFLIPVSAILNDESNIVDVVTAYERGLPEKMKAKVKYIFMSTSNAEAYRLKYEEEFGTIVTHTDTKNYMSRLGNRQIIGIPNEAMGDLIFGFADGNLLELIDLNDVPAIHDVQVLDYVVKIFAEGRLGYDFAYAPAVFVADTDVAQRGLQNATLNSQYYGELDLTSGSGS